MAMEKTPADTYRAFLRRVYFLKDLAETEIGELAALCSEEDFPAGTVVFVEGAVADKFYIVMEGKVEVWKSFREDQRSLLAVHGAGHFFGEMALVDDLPRSATLVARENSRTLFISRSDFQRLIRTNASIAISVMKSISLMVRSSNETFVEDLRERNARLEIALSELKDAQDELVRNERLSTIGKFSSFILHDLRNPISVLKALAELGSLHADDPEAIARDMGRMKEEILRMERFTQEFLDYSRGEIHLDMEVVAVESLFERLRKSLGDRLQASGIEMVLADEVGKPIIADGERFSRALLNLADNARKAMHSGGTLTVRAEERGGRIVFTVSDTGEGMSPDTLSRIYEPFFSKSGRGGTGLGMLIVKNIVEAHEGEIAIRSSVGEGTVVTVSIPSRM